MIRLYKIYLPLNQHGCGKPTMSSSFSYETNHGFFNHGFSTFPGWDGWTLCASSQGGVSISCSEKRLINWHYIFYLLLDSLLVYIQIVYTICSNSWWSSSNRPSMLLWCWRSPLWSQEYSHALHGMRQKKPNPLLLQSSSPCFVQTQDEHVKMRQCRNCGP